MVDALRRLFAGETVTLDGTTFALDGARLGHGRPDIEVVLAGRGPRMSALAARAADAFVLSYLHRDTIGGAVTALRAERPVHAVYSTMLAVTDADVEEARAQLTFRLVDSPPQVKAALRLGAAEVDVLRNALAMGGPTGAAHLIRPEWVPHFVLVGSPGECAVELRRLMDLHRLDGFQLGLPDPDRAAERMAVFAAALAALPEA